MLLCALLLTGLASPALAADIPSPESFLGRKVGEDRFLAPYPKVLSYLKALDAASDRVSTQVLGRSTRGEEMLLVVITSESNQRELDTYRGIARRLARPEGLGDAEAAGLIDRGKAIVLVTCSIHATEVASTQMSMELAWRLATTTDADTRAWLDEVILLLVPSINPDGQVTVIDWYNKNLGTEHEGGPLPWLYHPYTGHDNNRDFYMLTQAETRLVNDLLYKDWFPQVFLDEHQMGSTGPRMFVPPQTDPVAPEVPSLVLRQAGMLGTLMALRLEQAGKTGVGDHMIFDSYWPGGTRNTAWWKNVVGLLTEVASARMATPILIEPGELQGNVKGLPEHARRANYLTPWTGGWWRLRDIVDYELIATQALLEGSARHRRDLLRTFLQLNREAIERGRSEPPYAFVISARQHDPVAAARLVALLLRHGVVVQRADDAIEIGSQGMQARFPAGSYVVPAAQPYRPFLLTMLRPQRYPEVTAYPGGPILPPYDVTSWSLPLLMGVDIVEATSPLDARAPLRTIDEPVWPGLEPAGPAGAPAEGGWLIPHAADSAFVAMNRLLARRASVHWLADPPEGGASGDVWIPARDLTPRAAAELATAARVPIRSLARAPRGAALRLGVPRVALYKPWLASMDEGWTRWLLEQYEFPYVNVTNEDIRKGTFARSASTLVIPDVAASVLAEGKPSQEERRGFEPLPPEYAGGLEKEGAEALRRWVRQDGGVIVALDSSADYVIDLLELPVTNVLDKVPAERFRAPGSMLRLLVDTRHPLAYGMRPVEAGYFADSPAFQTRLPDPRFERRVVATYPESEEDILVSGFLEGAQLLRRKAAVVDLRVGKGRVVLIGIRAQHRAQPHRTFKLLFNALYLSGLEEVTLP